jgi:hypothetical protein
LNDVHTVSVGRAFLDLHCLTTYDATQQIDKGAFVVVGMVSVLHFFAFSPSSTRRRALERSGLGQVLVIQHDDQPPI